MTADVHGQVSRFPKRDRGYDLHVHTTHSDGGCTPSEVVIAGASVGLQGLAITDHDTVSGLASARREAERLGIDLIAGIELTVTHEDREYHLLGYYFREESPPLVEALARCRDHLARRGVELAGRLARLGYRVEFEEVARMCPRSQPGRRHFAQWLFRSGQLASPRQAFNGMMEQGGPAFVPKVCLNVEQGISLLKQSGGTVALAHPPRDLGFRRVAEFREQRLDAIEIRWPGLPASRSERLLRWARELDLVPLAGSDFHEPGPSGRWVGLLTTPAAAVSELARRASSRSGRMDQGDGSPETVPQETPTKSLR